MSTLAVSAPFPIYPDIDGKPLDNGSIYIGVAGLSAALNPINVYADAALSQLVPQPIKTNSGYPLANGVRCRLFIGDTDYSILILNSRGSIVSESLNAGVLSPIPVRNSAGNIIVELVSTGV